MEFTEPIGLDRVAKLGSRRELLLVQYFWAGCYLIREIIDMYDGGLYYTKEEMKKFKEIFSLIAAPIEDFAEKYNLFIEKYYYGCPKWTLFFVRSVGGVAQIYIDY